MNVDDYRVKPGKKVDLSKWDPNDTDDVPDKDAGKEILKVERNRIRDIQERLYAENKQSLLVVFQAMDTGGKDGAIKDVFLKVNPAGVRVRSFKRPNDTELSHDFLWRIHQHTPRTGVIQVFNRSHYEDVIITRVKDLVSPDLIERRYDQINMFEEMLYTNSNTNIIKFYLHISKDEQKRRLESRLEDPRKHWKYSSADLQERAYWDDYQRAFEQVLARCSTDDAPWYVVPANHKWFRNVVVAKAIADRLEAMNPQFPDPEPDLDKVVIPD